MSTQAPAGKPVLIATLAKHKRWAEAAALAAGLAGEYPGDARWPLLAGQLYTAADSLDQAAVFLREAGPIADTASAPPPCEELLEAWETLGLKAFWRQNDALAREGLEHRLRPALEHAAANPAQPESFLCLTQALQRDGHAAEALPYHGAALRLYPEHAPLLYNAVHCCLQSGALNQAEAWIAAAVPVQPPSPELTLARSALLAEQGKHEQALALLTDAMALLDQTALPRQRRMLKSAQGRSLHALGRWHDALKAFKDALALLPEEALPPGESSKRQSDALPDSSQEIFSKTQATPDALPAANPPDPAENPEAQAEARGLRIAIGNTLLALEQREDVSALWRGVPGISPEEQTFWRIKEALAFPPVLEAPGQDIRLRKELEEALLSALPNTPDAPYPPDTPGQAFPFGKLCADPLALQATPPFRLAFHGHDDRALLEKIAAFMLARTPFGPDTARPSTLPKAEKAAALARKTAGLRPPKERRVGFISAYFCNHTIMSYFFRLLHGICQDRNQQGTPPPFLLTFAQPPNPYWKALSAIGQPHILPSHVEGAARAIRALDLDMLVYLDLGMSPLTWMLAYRRLAPIQATLYGHPMTTGLPGVDVFLSPASMEPPNAQAFYSEVLHPLPCLLSGYSAPALPRAEIPALRKKGPLYLCAQSLFKTHPDDDAVVADILRQDPHGHFCFFASRNPTETRILRERLARVLGQDIRRVHFFQQRSEAAFQLLLQQADAVLDTQKFSGGSTSFIALGLGVPVITMEGPYLRSRQTAALYRHIGQTACIADSSAGMAQKALNLAHSPRQKHELSQAIRAAAAPLFSVEESVAALYAYVYSR